MAQHDYVIANGTGAAVRSDLNNALAAIVSQNSGATAPATTYAFQFWADTTTGLLKLRNSANNAWVTLFQLDGEWSTLPVENGTAAAPSIYFKDSGTDTGFYSPGTDQIGISTAGTSRLTIDANGNLAVDTNTLYVDAPNNRVGIGTSSPGAIIHSVNTSAGTATIGAFLQNSSLTAGTEVRLGFAPNTNPVSDNRYSWIGAVNVGGSNDSALTFATTPGGTPATERMRITPSGLVGIGSTTPRALLDVGGSTAFNAGTYQAPKFAVSNGYISIKSDAADGVSRLTLIGDSATGDATIDWGGNTNANLIFSNNGSNKARIDSSGRWLLGTSSAFDSTTEAKIQVAAGNGAYLSLGIDDTTVTTAENLGLIRFYSRGGNVWEEGARIEAEADLDHASGDKPTRLVFSTTADGASSPTERLRIANNGAWGLGGANYGSSSQVLTSNGSGSAPTWQTVTAAAPAALSTASGSAPSYSARAWVNFNGSGAVAIRANGNVSSITDNGTGDYTVNFTTAMADANYAVTGIPEFTNTRPDPTICIAPSGLQTGSVRINVGMSNGLYMDTNTVCVSIFR